MAEFLFSPGTAATVPYSVIRSQPGPYVEDDWANSYAELVGSRKAFPTWVRGVINDPDAKQNGLYVCTGVSDETSTWSRLITLAMLEAILAQLPTAPGGGNDPDPVIPQDGEDGQDGRTLRIYTGQNEPGNDLGLLHDYYIRFNGRMYEKMENNWESRGALNLGNSSGGGGQQFYFGPMAPEANPALPVDLQDGVQYLNTTNGWLYAMEDGVWTYLVTLKGTKGEAGPPGTVHLIRPVQPTPAEGADGYLWTQYVTLRTERRFVKINGSWFKYYDNIDGEGGETPEPEPSPKAVITFAALASRKVGDPSFALTASSTNAVTAITFTSSNTNVVTVANVSGTWRATIVAAGTSIITADQAAGNGFLAADSVSRQQQITSATVTPIKPNAPTFSLFNDTANTITVTPDTDVPMSLVRYQLPGSTDYLAAPSNGQLSVGDVAGTVKTYSIAGGNFLQSDVRESQAFTKSSTPPNPKTYDNTVTGGNTVKGVTLGAISADTLEFDNFAGPDNSPITMELWLSGQQVASVPYEAYYTSREFRYTHAGVAYTKNFTSGRIDL